MKNNKFWLAGIVGGVLMFVLGWLVYGMLLMNFMTEHAGLPADIMKQVYKEQDQMNFGAMIVSNLVWGFLIALVMGWSGANSLGSGIRNGLIFGLLVAAGFDLIMFGTSNMMTMQSMLADIVGFALMVTITSGVTAMILGKGKTAAA